MKNNSKKPKIPSKARRRATAKSRRAIPWRTGTRVEQPKKGRKSYNRSKEKKNNKKTLYPYGKDTFSPYSGDDDSCFGVNW